MSYEHLRLQFIIIIYYLCIRLRDIIIILTIYQAREYLLYR